MAEASERYLVRRFVDDPTDYAIVMPGQLAGRELAERAVQIRPSLKVLFASGYFEGALVSKGDLETDVRFIGKPYRKRDLVVKIDEVLKVDA